MSTIQAIASGDSLKSAVTGGVKATWYSSAGIDDRKVIEPELFGGHPVYAYVDFQSRHYGNYSIAINPEAVIATGTEFDSLQMWLSTGKKMRDYIVSSPTEEYWEAQIHSEVSAEEILYIDFDGDEVPSDIIYGLHSRGIECRNYWLHGCGPASWYERLKKKSEMTEGDFYRVVEAIADKAA
jgi:hypothetical protein